MPNEPTTPVEAEGLRLLTDAELDAVSGGIGSEAACKAISNANNAAQADAVLLGVLQRLGCQPA